MNEIRETKFYDGIHDFEVYRYDVRYAMPSGEIRQMFLAAQGTKPLSDVRVKTILGRVVGKAKLIPWNTVPSFTYPLPVKSRYFDGPLILPFHFLGPRYR